MIIAITLASMGGLAALLAVLLYFISKKFHVEVDNRVQDVQAMLPGVNCGACGFAGCSGMADAFVKGADKGDINGLYCPPGGQTTLENVSAYLGMTATAGEKKVAVLRCGGSCSASPSKTKYQGPASCTMSHGLFSGEGACAFGCLGQGECVAACQFDAMRMNPETGLPEIDAEKCTACEACVKACPRNLIQMRPYGKRSRRVWVNCRNTEKGAVAKKNCDVACIACGKCVKVCDEIVQAITMENNLAYIDPAKCIACGKCVHVCPTHSILASFNVPAPKPVAAKEDNKETA